MLKKQYSEFCQDKVILACFGKLIFSNYKLCFKKYCLILGNILVCNFAFVGFNSQRAFSVQERWTVFNWFWLPRSSVLSIVCRFCVFAWIFYQFNKSGAGVSFCALNREEAFLQQIYMCVFIVSWFLAFSEFRILILMQ